jgi:hypothetical protein
LVRQPVRAPAQHQPQPTRHHRTAPTPRATRPPASPPSRQVSAPPTKHRRPTTSLGPKIAQPIITPLRNLGRDISHLTGWSVFAGPLGWLLTAVMLLAVAMIVTALALGRRRSSAVRR